LTFVSLYALKDGCSCILKKVRHNEEVHCCNAETISSDEGTRKEGIQMRKAFCVLLLCCCGLTTQAQGDSLQSALNIPNAPVQLADTRISQKADSIEDRLPENTVTDSAVYYRAQLDSITRNVNAQLDSLHDDYASVLGGLNEKKNALSSRIDSLTRLNLPAGGLTGKLDSIQQQIAGVERDLQGKIQAVQQKAFSKMNAIEFPPELKSEVSSVQSALSKLTTVNVTDNVTTRLPAVAGMGLNTPKLSQASLSSQHAIPPAGSVLPPGNAIGVDIPMQAGGITEGLKPQGLAGLPTGNAEIQGTVQQAQQLKAQPLDNIADSKVSGISEVKEVQQATHIDQVDAIKSDDALKAELKKQARTAATDHFAGKQEQIRAAMEKLSKYKAKYQQVNSISDLKTKPVNPMKGKSLAERIVPGINLQVQHRGDILVDFNPYAGYKITSRITAGLGWNQRLGYNWDVHAFSPTSKVFGPRVFAEYKLGKGFVPRVEVEMMNTRVPPATVLHGDPYGRRWVPCAFAGIKKEYRLAGRLKGTASIMVRVFDPKRQSPYGDVLNARFGFELAPKKKAKD
jgi:hypothetical protein